MNLTLCYWHKLFKATSAFKATSVLCQTTYCSTIVGLDQEGVILYTNLVRNLPKGFYVVVKKKFLDLQDVMFGKQ